MKPSLPQSETSVEVLVAEVADEFLERIDRGEQPSVDEYVQRYPQITTLLRQILPALEVMRQPADDTADRDGLPEDRRLGDFRILREIGRGGMGIVYEAEQISLGRLVAVKVLPFAAILDERQLQRFKSEARAAATLSHPHIVPVHFVGSERSVHFYAMQLIQGHSLAQALAELRAETLQSPLPRAASGMGERDRVRGSAVERRSAAEREDPHPSPLPQAGEGTRSVAPDVGEGTRSVASNVGEGARLAETDRGLQALLSTHRERDGAPYWQRIAQIAIQAAEALEYAHSKGVIHRDIKPANLLLDIDGNTWITDFGLAHLENETSATLTGDLVGTFRYMSPEQASGGRAVIDERTDVYSLGATLYELLTLQPLVDGADRQTILKRIAQEEPRPPRKIHRSIPVDLETIVLKAVEKSPVDRYAAAQQLADDLRRFVEQKPVQARRRSVLQHLSKWYRRNRKAVLAAAITLMLVLAASMAIVTRAYSVAVQERTRAEEREAQARANLQIAIDAVDDMYTGIAAEWLGSSGELSRVQQKFLKKALNIYEIVLQQPDSGPEAELRKADVFARTAHIHYRLGQHTESVQSLRKAIAMREQLVSHQPTNTRYRGPLLDAYSSLSLVLRDLGRHDEALEALNQAGRHTQQLIRDDQDPKVPLYRLSQAINDVERAQSLIALRQLDAAERSIRQSQSALQRLAQEMGNTLEVPWHLLQGDRLLSDILRRQERTDEALKICKDAFARCTRLRIDFPDNALVAELESSLTYQLAVLLETTNQLEESAASYRKALELAQQSLKVRLKPIQWSVAVMFKQLFREPVYEQRDAFCAYVETQIRLARVLQQLGIFYEAELLLGEATRVSQILTDLDSKILRYQVAHANAWVETSQLLQQRRPAEAHAALSMATALWRDMLQQFPEARSHCSRARDPVYDWQWFVQTFPQQQGELPTTEHATTNGDGSSADSEARLGPCRNTAFWQHASGVCRFEGELWKLSIDSFTRSAQLLGEDATPDWLYLAMAHAHIGEAELARTWYDKANTWIEEHPTESNEYLKLRDQAAKLLGIY